MADPELEATTRLVTLPTVAVPHALKEALKDLATKHGRTLQDEMTEGLKEYLSSHGAWPPPPAG